MHQIMLAKCIPEKESVVSKPSKRMPFKPEEDQKLRELVEKYGDSNWNLISSFMPNRSVRQCRERWNNNLSSNILKDKWSPKEDELLKQKYYEFGPKWKLLEKFFPGRTSYNIRNRWACIVRLWNLYSRHSIHNQQTIAESVKKIVPNNQIKVKQLKKKVPQQNPTFVQVEKMDSDEIHEFSSELESIDDSLELCEFFLEDNYNDCFY
ncbi:hypothetical protein M9Y10_008597 [Tritrichomonas musculus]|uniref:Myb-like DNA-binding domain containing protein n=1 Tax=Tritrichomonas musculus TaxID=1915356 RepID=A0ABR2IYL2_9EUKA